MDPALLAAALARLTDLMTRCPTNPELCQAILAHWPVLPSALARDIAAWIPAYDY